MVCFGLVWFSLTWFGLVWFGLIGLVGVVWFGLVWFGLVWFDLVWFGLVRFDLVCRCMIAEPRSCSQCTVARTAGVIYKVLYTSIEFGASPQRFSVPACGPARDSLFSNLHRLPSAN